VVLVDVDVRLFATIAAEGTMGVDEEVNEDEEHFCRVGTVKAGRSLFCARLVGEDIAESGVST